MEQMQYMYLVFIPILMIFVMSEYINALEFDIIMMEGAPSEYLFSHGQLLVIHLLGLASLFCILFAYKKGAKLITRDQKELWNIPAPDTCEMQYTGCLHLASIRSRNVP